MYKLAVVFPGQGAQYVGMSQGILKDYSIAQETFEEASDTAGFDVRKLCLDGPLSRLSHTKNAHVAILASGVAAFRVFMQEIGYPPQFCAGHSLGEYLSLACSGVFRFKDTVNLVAWRAELAERAAAETNGGMTVIEGVEPAKIEAACEDARASELDVYVSSYTALEQTAISGTLDALAYVEDRVLAQGARVTPLIGSAPYHSPLMAPYAKELEDALSGIELFDFRYPVVSNVTAKPIRGKADVRQKLAAHLVSPVQWVDTLRYYEDKGITLVIEMGPKNLATNLVRQFTDGIKAVCLGNRAEREEIFSLYKGTEMYSKHIPTLITKCLVAGVATPNQNWDNDAYRSGVIEPYGRIRSIQEGLESGGIEPSMDVDREALSLLKKIFDTKLLPIEEQRDWFRQILEETGRVYSLAEFAL